MRGDRHRDNAEWVVVNWIWVQKREKGASSCKKHIRVIIYSSGFNVDNCNE